MLVIIATAFLVGHMIYKARVNILVTTIIAIVAIFASIWLGTIWKIQLGYTFVLVCVLIFGYFSSILPV